MLRWRQKEKLKTTAVALVLCLNIGVDPPDVIKISPCARLECWVDPMSNQPAKALETIGASVCVCVVPVFSLSLNRSTACSCMHRYHLLVRCVSAIQPISNHTPSHALTGKNLQAQYERWQPKAKYKTHLDPTVDEVKKLAQSCRYVRVSFAYQDCVGFMSAFLDSVLSSRYALICVSSADGMPRLSACSSTTTGMACHAPQQTER